MTMDFTLSLDFILPSLWEQAHDNSKDPLLVFPTISGNSPISWKPRLNSNSKLGNSDLNANQGSESHVFLSTLHLVFVFCVFFGRKELRAQKLIIVITHAVYWFQTAHHKVLFRRLKGGETPRKKGEGESTQLQTFQSHSTRDPPPFLVLSVTQLLYLPMKKRNR